MRSMHWRQLAAEALKTTLILTSDEIATNLHANVPGARSERGAGIFYVPCNATYPTTSNLFITVGPKKFGVPIEDLAWAESSKYPGMCISGVQVSFTPETPDIQCEYVVLRHFFLAGRSTTFHRIGRYLYQESLRLLVL